MAVRAGQDTAPRFAMALKITCPHCGRPIRLEEPYPLPGAERQCACGRTLAITYPMGMMELLKRRGGRFAEEAEAPARPPEPPVPAARRSILPAEAPPRGEPAEALRSVPPPDPQRRPAASKRPPEPPTAATELDRQVPRSTEPTEVDPASSATGQVVQTATPPPPRRYEPRRKAAPKAAPKRPSRMFWVGRGMAAVVVFVVVAAVLGVGGVAGIFYYYSQDLPTLEALAQYRPPTVTVVYDDKGELLGEIYEKRRYVVPLDQMPSHLRNAFIAAEDAGFYKHDGVDYMGIVRAIGRNALEGRMAQGASTITQQVARNFLLTNEKKLSRKIREALLAWRIEEAFEKDHILYLYLNQIYLGSGAYGVEAAARVYFGKHVEELTLGEAAIIAGLPQRPSDYSPHRHMDKAKARQKYVLEQMVDKGLATRAEVDAAYAENLVVVERTNEFLLKAPWFTEHIRRYLVEKYGFDKVYNDGLVVESTCNLHLQAVAQAAVTEGVTHTDSRAGWRGPHDHMDAAQIPAFVADLSEKYETLLEGERYKGVIIEVKKKHAVVDLGEAKALVPLMWTEWAYKPDPARSAKGRRQDDLTRALNVGDVVTIELSSRDFKTVEGLKEYKEAGDGPFYAAKLYQEPELQGALYSMRNDTGAVVAMVGGVDFRGTEFNRAIQAYRQVGSTFKPIVYAAAIASKRFTVATIVPDAPLVFRTIGPELWKPENYGEDYLGDITLRKALALSRNVVTIRVLDTIKLPIVVDIARKIGVQTKMEEDLSMGLGASSLTMPEMTTAYATFANLGKRVDPHYVNKVVDRDNVVLEEWTTPEWPQVLDASVAGVMTWLLQEVASNGTAAKTQSLGLHVAGKTGTTNEFRDAWFVGYTPGLTTSVWVGYDQPRSIGNSSTGGTIALPIWMDYTREAVPKSENRPFPAAPGLTWVGIDESTGRSVKGGRSMPFLSGTAPRESDVEANQKTSQDMLTTEF